MRNDGEYTKGYMTNSNIVMFSSKSITLGKKIKRSQQAVALKSSQKVKVCTGSKKQCIRNDYKNINYEAWVDIVKIFGNQTRSRRTVE